MNLRFRQVAAVLALLAASATAQYTLGPATGPFTPIAGTAGATMLTTVSACDDCTQPLTLPFPFPWFGGTLTTLTVTSNGAVLMGAFTDSLCCSNWALDFGIAAGTPVYFTQRPWIAVAQEDLNPGSAGDVWQLNTAVSTVVSWENVAFFGTTGTSLNAQVELFMNGDIDIRFGTSTTGGNNISTGLTNPATAAWFSPSSLLAQYNAVGQTTGGVVPQNAGVIFSTGNPLPPPQFDTNTPTSSLTFNGVNGGPFSKAATSSCANAPVNAVSLGTAGQGWEVAFNVAPTVGVSQPGSLVTAGGQIVNIDLTQGLYFLFGGLFPNFVPHPGNFPVTFGAPAGVFSVQQVVFDPTNAEGFSLSQACQHNAGLALQSATVAGPLFDDSEVAVPVGCVSFFGQSFSQLFIESNGRLIFGSTGNTQFTPVVANFISDGPSFGIWTDLNPGVGGTITLTSPAPGVINVAYANVPYFATTVPNSFQLQLDTTSGIASIIGLGGLGAGTGQMLIGISGGSAVGATDPGAANFSPGGAGTTGTTGNGTAMIYQTGIQGSVTTGINRIDFIPNPFANYDWISQ